MPKKPAQVCTKSWCNEVRPCPVHDRAVNRQRMDKRPSAARRGYGAKWRKRREEFLREHPLCVDCGQPSAVPDHYPLTRRELVECGVTDPDADEYLVARCASCHSRKTAVRDGGFGQRSGGGI